MDWQAIIVSLKLAACTCTAVLPIALLLGWALSHRRWRGRDVLEAIVAMPLVLPPTVIGFFLLWSLSPVDSGLGRFLDSLGIRLPFSFAGLVVGSTLYSLPFAVQPIAAVMRSIDRTLIDSALCLGASRARVFWSIVLPLSLPGIAVGMILTFAHALGEFGIVLMIGGARPGHTLTASVAIYNDVQSMRTEAALGTSAVLIGIGMFALLAAMWIRRRLWGAISGG